MTRKVLALAVLASALALPARGTAATTRTIEMRRSPAPGTLELVPRSLVAATGDTLTWKAMNDTHVVSVYAATGASTVFESGPIGDASPDKSFSTTFAGGTLSYRCKVHSSLSSATPPVCSGACGYITDTAPAGLPGPPAFTSPAEAEQVTAEYVTLRGTAESGTKSIRLREYPSSGGIHELALVPVESGVWQYPYPNSLTNGTYKFDAFSVSDEGYEAGPSPARTFTAIIGDVAPPRVVLDKPMGPIVASTTMEITGRVIDDVSVVAIDVTVTDELLGTKFMPKANCNPTCDGSASNPSFYASIALMPGSYTVTVTGVDATGKVGRAERKNIIAL